MSISVVSILWYWLRMAFSIKRFSMYLNPTMLELLCVTSVTYLESR